MDGSDLELVVRLRARDAAAFEELAARYRDRLRQHLARLLADSDQVEDLLQEVFIRLWTLDPSRLPADAFRPWLYRVATNLALNFRRDAARRPDQPATDGQPLEPPVTAGAEQQWQSAHDRRLCRQMVAALPADKRTVVQLVYQDELSLHEVATRLGIPEGTVKSRLHHARRHLARRWRELDPDVEDPT